MNSRVGIIKSSNVNLPSMFATRMVMEKEGAGESIFYRYRELAAHAVQLVMYLY